MTEPREDPWWSWDTEDDDEWMAEFSGSDVRALVRERNRLLAGVHLGDEGLTFAWKRAEAALPEGWWIDYVMADWWHDQKRWAALARADHRDDGIWIEEHGDSPAAALNALADRLTEGDSR